jgi:hypothetical protein
MAKKKHSSKSSDPNMNGSPAADTSLTAHWFSSKSSKKVCFASSSLFNHQPYIVILSKDSFLVVLTNISIMYPQSSLALFLSRFSQLLRYS